MTLIEQRTERRTDDPVIRVNLGEPFKIPTSALAGLANKEGTKLILDFGGVTKGVMFVDKAAEFTDELSDMDFNLPLGPLEVRLTSDDTGVRIESETSPISIQIALSALELGKYEYLSCKLLVGDKKLEGFVLEEDEQFEVWKDPEDENEYDASLFPQNALPEIQILIEKIKWTKTEIETELASEVSLIKGLATVAAGIAVLLGSGEAWRLSQKSGPELTEIDGIFTALTALFSGIALFSRRFYKHEERMLNQLQNEGYLLPE